MDPNDSSRIISFYTGKSLYGEWDGGKTWNKEHVWPQSTGWDKGETAGADLHHIRACESGVNSSRGNKPYSSSTTNQYYYPGDEFKGDVARIIFYLLVRYADEVVSKNINVNDVVSSFDLLIKWNNEDPVSNLEITRNNYVYSVQGNRNPFIDNSNYANMIWG